MGLDDPPEGVLGELLERPPGPVAVARLAQPVVDQRLGPGHALRAGTASSASAVSRQRCSGLVTSAATRHRGEPLGEGLRLGAAGVVEADAGVVQPASVPLAFAAVRP